MTDPFSVASGAVGVVSLGLTVCQGLLQFYRSWKDSQKDVVAMCASLEGLTKTFRLVESTIKDRKFNQAIVDRVTASIDLCETGVHELDAKLLKVKQTPVKGNKDQIRGQFRRTLYPFKENTLLKLRTMIADLRDNLSLAISTLQLDVSATSLQKIDAIDGNLASLMSSSSTLVDGVAKVQLSQAEHGERVRREERLGMIRWLSPLHFGDKQKDTFGGRQKGTGGWLLRDTCFTDWLEGKTMTLWCSGMPGAGKTVLASTIIDHLQQTIQSSNVAVVYIYCHYNEQNQTAVNLVASVVQQLAQQQFDLPEEISAIYNHHIRAETTPSLSEYSKLLRSQIQNFSKLLIVIDALDECLDGHRAILLDELQDLSPAPYLLVTSRHIPTIEKRLREASFLEIEAKEEDVRVFLEAWLDQQDLCVRLIKADPLLRELIMNTILGKSHGMFLLAVLHTNLLAGEDNKKDFLTALQSLPVELDDTYDQAMLRIQGQSRQQIKRAEQVLSWVTLAERPLTVKEMQCALAIAPGDTFLDEDALPDETLMVSVCAGLVVIDKQTSTIRLVHYTTQDYLERNLDARYPHAQRNICETCITYLSFEVFVTASIRTYKPSEWTPFLRKTILLAYAAQNWGNHARKAPSHDMIIVDELVHGFIGRGANFSFSNQVFGYLKPRENVWGVFSLSTDDNSVVWKDLTALSSAALFGLERTMRTLLQEGHDVNAKDTNGWSSLHVAAETEYKNIIQLLLEKGADIEAKARDGITALHRAAVAGRENSVRMLLEKGSDPAYDAMSYFSMFRNAACRGHWKIVQLLLLYVGDVKRKDHCAVTALSEAAKAGLEGVVKKILEGYADLERRRRIAAAVLPEATQHISNTSVLDLLLENAHVVKGDNDLQDALWEAVRSCNESAIQLILDAGADPNQQPDKCQIPILHCATESHYSGSLGVLKMLVEAGADIEATNSNGWTPLLLAAKKGETRIIRFLLDVGANAAVKEQKTGRGALQWAAITGHLEAVHPLLQHHGESTTDNKWSALAELFEVARGIAGATQPQILKGVNSLDPRENEVLMLWHLVAERGQESVLEVLLNIGIDIEARNDYGDTALILAAAHGQEGIVRLLLSKGANVNASSDLKNNAGTPLSEAAEKRPAGMVLLRHLLDAGADVGVEYRRKNGTTPLNMVCTRSDEKSVETIVQMLLEHGADTEVGDYYGWTPLISMASKSFGLSSLRLLLDHGANMEAKDRHGNTALCRAAEEGTINNVGLLLERGADPKSVDFITSELTFRLLREDHDECVRLIRDAQRERDAKSVTASAVENQVTKDETESTDAGGE